MTHGEHNSDRRLRSLAVVGLLFLVVHFAMTSLYTMPAIPATPAMSSAARSYMWPAFHQGWHLFAPGVPGFQNKLYYRVPSDGEWGEWVDADTIAGRSHARIPYITQKICTQLHGAINGKTTGVYYLEGDPQYDKVMTSSAFKFAVYYCAQEYRQAAGNLPDSLQLRLDYLITPDFHSGRVAVEQPVFQFPTYVIQSH